MRVRKGGGSRDSVESEFFCETKITKRNEQTKDVSFNRSIKGSSCVKESGKVQKDLGFKDAF